MTWKLSEISERIAYRDMAFSSGRESANVISNGDLQLVDAAQVAEEVFAADEEAGLLDVDDVEEAKAIFIPAFAEGYEDLRKCRKEDVVAQMDRTKEIIDALEPHRKIISGAIAFRKDHPDRQESAIRGFVKNNAAILGIENSARLCVNWGLVVEHFKEVA